MLEALWSSYTAFDYTVMGINLLLLVFSRRIVTSFAKSKNEKAANTKILFLRIVNVTLFALYFSAFFLSDLTKQLSQTGLTLLLSFLVIHIAQVLIIKRFGRSKEIDGTEYSFETYQSEVFGLLVVLVVVIIGVLIVINIWEMNDWLKATSVLGGILIIFFSTKDVWVPDNIHGLILLYNGNVEAGSVIKVDELDLLAIAIQTSLTETVFRDLRSRHFIILPNSRLRGSKIEVLSRCPPSGLLQFADFNLSYGLETAETDRFFQAVWQRACKLDKSINGEKLGVAKLANTGDHAVTWRLGYWVKNVYGIYDAKYAVNRAAYETALEFDIRLDTPLTHVIDLPMAENIMRLGGSVTDGGAAETPGRSPAKA